MGSGFSIENELERARDTTLNYKARSAIWHGLMDVAELWQDDALWNEIGEIIILAFSRDDVSAKISDHFVEKCPDVVFRKYALQGPHDRYVRWRQRTQELLPDKLNKQP